MGIFKRFITATAALIVSVAVLAQSPDRTVSWTVSQEETGDGLFELTFTADILPGWHIYSAADSTSPTRLEFEDIAGYEPVGTLEDIDTPADNGENLIFERSARFRQQVRLTSDSADVKGYITCMVCREGMCTMVDKDIEISLKKAVNKNVSAQNAVVSPTENESDGSQNGNSLWSLLLEAVLWGFAMLLTPCVFPMVPMTVSFFMKSSGSAAAGRLKAAFYGLSIVLLYTVPISVIILLTRVIGGEAVTADIFNWLATHWLPNIVFFVIFMLFAASFFGAFEITLPSSIVNKSDRQTGRAGLGGVFFMALTLVLVSFSCTGPIVGSVLIKSTQGEFWTPMVTMLAFSVAFALPFTLLALFPSFLKKMKSGSWLNSVKVVLGFIEVALGFKFLSTADQTYHWGLLDREVYLAIWIVTFSLLGLYLLGKIRFKNDDPGEKPLTVTRLALSIAVFSFVVYLIPGMWGAPLKALSGYLPPLETQDFVVYSHSDGHSAPAADNGPATAPASNGYGLSLPLGLSGYFTLEEGLEASKKEGKPVFVDVTGHGCVNCREMEQRVWSDPAVLEILRDRYIIVALYVDDKTKLEEKDYVTDDNGKTYKNLGRKNSYIARTRFGVNAQPNYILLDSDGEVMVPVRGYSLDVDGFVSFLNSGLEAFAGR
jgi:cytochrome c biogenesis protein CcdA/thioredoxin-related protein